jgi:hypothetical protein
MLIATTQAQITADVAVRGKIRNSGFCAGMQMDEELAVGKVIPPGITSSLTRNPSEEW